MLSNPKDNMASELRPLPQGDNTAVPGDTPKERAKFPGVIKMEEINSELKRWERWLIFASLFLMGWAIGLDALVRSTYQAYATSSYAQHSLLSTVNVIKSVVAATVGPTVAKLSDQIGRLELFITTTVFFVVGTIIETCALNVQTFSIGAILYSIGYSCTLAMFDIVIADLSSIRSRIFFILVPNLPYVFNTWISGNLTSAVLGTTTWQWGIGMWSIIYPVCTLPFITILATVGHRASKKRSNRASSDKGPVQRAWEMFRTLDVPGLFMLTASLAMTLIPLTLAGGETKKWQSAGIITPLVLGILLFPVFVLWEAKASNPVIPMYLFRNRGVWAAMAGDVLMMFSWYMQADFLYTVLVVSFDFSIEAATRVSSTYNFCSVLSGAVVGLIIRQVRRPKPFVIAGIGLWLLAYGLLYYYRGGSGGSARSGVIAGQVLLGIGGLATYPNFAIAQAVCKHEDVALIISLMLAMTNIGVALGGCVSGAIWTQTLYDQLKVDLASNVTLSSSVYQSPLTVVPLYPVGTPERDAIIHSYRYIQRLLTITGMCLSVPMLAVALCLPDLRFPATKAQNVAESH